MLIISPGLKCDPALLQDWESAVFSTVTGHHRPLSNSPGQTAGNWILPWHTSIRSISRLLNMTEVRYVPKQSKLFVARTNPIAQAQWKEPFKLTHSCAQTFSRDWHSSMSEVINHCIQPGLSRSTTIIISHMSLKVNLHVLLVTYESESYPR